MVGKSTIAVILANSNAYVLVSIPAPTSAQSKTEVFCVEAYSTAFKYPLSDAIVDNAKKTITSPLDGTIYSLETGAVLEWCPKDNPLRWVLGSLKEREKINLEANKLKTYPCVLKEDGNIYMTEEEQ